MSPTLTVVLAAAFLGLLFGSFLNVCIARLPAHESIVRPASRCPACHHPILWRDNIPAVSYLLLRARCRHCDSSISWRYPAVELATAVWFVFACSPLVSAIILPRATPELLANAILATLNLAVLGFLLIGLVVMDWRTQRLPNAFTFSGISIALLLVCTQAIFLGPTEDQVLLRHKAPITAAMSVEKGNVFLTGPEALIGGRILATLIAAGLLLAVRAIYKALRHRQGMGPGDVKLLAMIAAFLGLRSALLALFLSVFAASIYGIALLVTRRAHRFTGLPLGSFLAMGGLIVAAIGSRLIDTYTALYR